jgi:hypothetical protein
MGGFDSQLPGRLGDVMAGSRRRDTVGGLIGLAARSDDVTAGFAGNLNRGKPEQVRPDGIVRIASMTEPIVAAGALLVVEECRAQADRGRQANREPGVAGDRQGGFYRLRRVL